ncbi:hypothetical protein [Dyella sp.]|uniref:hypothetical protein n=1 Tax=Dyella sp. TaxID=1869338 RepID=UPI002D7A0533|nr:hypothetical protein [Dyella sp.]HET7332236.1 hypothetical protein [Dyella sp.]
MVLAFYLLGFGASASSASSEHAVLLPPAQARHVLQQCSRETPKPVSGVWTVSPTIIAELEQDLPKLSKLVSKTCCGKGLSVPDPSAFYRQYVGVSINGHNYVYINAFRNHPIYFHAKDRDRWRSEPEMVCDGGDSFWGALYDPESRQFSQLSFNGSV